MEVKVSLSSGIIDWTHNAESSAQHQDLISGFCWSIKQSISVPVPDHGSF